MMGVCWGVEESQTCRYRGTIERELRELTAIDKTIDRHHLKLLADTDWKFLY